MPAHITRRIAFCTNSQHSWIRISSVSIVTRLRAESQGNLGSILGKGRDLSLLLRIQTGSGAHTASCPMHTAGKAGEA